MRAAAPATSRSTRRWQAAGPSALGLCLAVLWCSACAGPSSDAGGSRSLAPAPVDSAAQLDPDTSAAVDGETDCPDASCDGECVNLDTDPRHCGGCGRTCWAAGAEAVCVDGVCALDTCPSGLADCDRDPTNGCEATVSCVEGAACPTSCASTGTQGCADPCAPTCAPPDEQCNAQDDDCNGACDEGAMAGCRASLYRSVGAAGHHYGRNPGEVAAAGDTLESAAAFFVYTRETTGLVPLYRCDKGEGRTFLTASSVCEIGLPVDGVMGWMAPVSACGASPLYRLYNSVTGDHLYTLSTVERDRAEADFGYTSEGIAGYVWTSP